MAQPSLSIASMSLEKSGRCCAVAVAERTRDNPKILMRRAVCMIPSVVLRDRGFIDYAEEMFLSTHKQFVIGDGNRDATRFAD